jgi:hypothetical protein
MRRGADRRPPTPPSTSRTGGRRGAYLAAARSATPDDRDRTRLGSRCVRRTRQPDCGRRCGGARPASLPGRSAQPPSPLWTSSPPQRTTGAADTGRPSPRRPVRPRTRHDQRHDRVCGARRDNRTARLVVADAPDLGEGTCDRRDRDRSATEATRPPDLSAGSVRPPTVGGVSDLHERATAPDEPRAGHAPSVAVLVLACVAIAASSPCWSSPCSAVPAAAAGRPGPAGRRRASPLTAQRLDTEAAVRNTWTLVAHDEFDGDELDEDLWSPLQGSDHRRRRPARRTT